MYLKIQRPERFRPTAASLVVSISYDWMHFSQQTANLIQFSPLLHAAWRKPFYFSGTAPNSSRIGRYVVFFCNYMSKCSTQFGKKFSGKMFINYIHRISLKMIAISCKFILRLSVKMLGLFVHVFRSNKVIWLSRAFRIIYVCTVAFKLPISHFSVQLRRGRVWIPLSKSLQRLDSIFPHPSEMKN